MRPPVLPPGSMAPARPGRQALPPCRVGGGMLPTSPADAFRLVSSEQIGRGTFGKVQVARHVASGTLVALKTQARDRVSIRGELSFGLHWLASGTPGQGSTSVHGFESGT